MTPALQAAAWLTGAAGLGLAAAALVATRRPAVALPVLLDFLLAAGLLRLAVADTWSAIGSAAALVAVRKLVVLGLRTPGRSRSLSPPARPAPR